MKSYVNLTILSFFAVFLSACEQKEAATTTVETPGPVTAAVKKEIPKYSAQTFFETTSFGLASSAGYAFSANGQAILMSSDATGVFNVYSQPVKGGKPQQLTQSTDNATFAISWFPGDDRALYTYDGGGNELNHVFVRETDGSSRNLTSGDELKASFLAWAKDGQSFYLTTTERDQKSFDIYQYSVSDYNRKMIFENPGFQISGISGDGRWIALDKPRTSADSDIFVVDLESDNNEPMLITGHMGNIQYGTYEFTPDNNSLVYATNEHGEFYQAWVYDLQSGESSLLVEVPWDVSNVAFSPSGRYRVTSINADARTEVTVIDSESGAPVELPDLPAGDLRSVRFSADETHMALIVNADDSPSNIHVIDLAEGHSHQLTQALNPSIDQSHLVTSEVVRYKSFDGLEIPSVLYKPHGASVENPVPALVLVHGGPGGQTRTGYRAMVQHLVNHGYAVLGANNRGSSGYGKTFNHLDDKHHGEDDLQVESDELVAKVQANEVPVEYLVFPDEGHGFRKRSNRITASDAYVKFLDIYLKGGEQE